MLIYSGDSTLSVFSLYKQELIVRSDYVEDDLMSATVLRSDSKVVCGTGSGNILMWNWDQWMEPSDRMSELGEGIEVVAAVGDSIACVATEEGTILYVWWVLLMVE